MALLGIGRKQDRRRDRLEEVVPWDVSLKFDIPFCCSLSAFWAWDDLPLPTHPPVAMIFCLTPSPKQGMQSPWIKIMKTVSRNKPSFLFFLSKIFLAEDKTKRKPPNPTRRQQKPTTKSNLLAVVTLLNTQHNPHHKEYRKLSHLPDKANTCCSRPKSSEDKLCADRWPSVRPWEPALVYLRTLVQWGASPWLHEGQDTLSWQSFSRLPEGCDTFWWKIISPKWLTIQVLLPYYFCEETFSTGQGFVFNSILLALFQGSNNSVLKCHCSLHFFLWK